MRRSLAIALAIACPVGLASALFIAACDSGSPASPAAGPAVEASDAGTFAVCPPGMDASFGSIYSQMLGTQSCGAGNDKCHDTNARSNVGVSLDYSLDAAAVFAELVGDGSGVPAANIAGDAQVRRVAPFDADASLLFLKLGITSKADPLYGSGMPFTAPGSVCPQARAAVQAWINGGAQLNPGPAEGGTGTPDSGTPD
jgi:hypothetical protein